MEPEMNPYLYIKFKANNDQLKVIAANAVNASRPEGLGYLHFKNRIIFPDEIKKPMDIDYYEGRMVKLHIRKNKDDLFILNEVDEEYQSWKKTYKTAEHLLRESGVNDIAFVPDLPEKIEF
jgi:hypothetical protein